MTGLDMIGIYQHSVDAKGRLFIPARLREELGETFYITVSPLDKCLTAYSVESWAERIAKQKAMKMSDQRKLRKYFAYGHRCDIDAQGRILLPQKHRAEVDMEKNVTINGTGVGVELWASEVWEEEVEGKFSAEETARSIEELDF